MAGQRENMNKPGDRTLAAEQIADLAHELRSPLGGIDAMIELLASGKTSPEQDQLINGLRAASAHMRAVASGVITPTASVPHTLQASVGEILAQFQVACTARARARELLYMQEIAAGCENVVVADATALRQMLENLVDNAFRLTRRGLVTLKVAPEGARMVRFDVLDQGPGLTDADAARIFGRGATLDDREAGTGLGLSIVARLAGKLGGSCGATSRGDDAGAHVWFALPVTEVRAPAKPVDEVSRYKNAGQPVLVVDDDATSRLLLTTVLDHLGIETVAIESPVEALKNLEAGAYSAIFTDVSMPGMNGVEFIRAVRAMPGAASRLPVVSVSGRVAPEDRQLLAEAGCNFCVDKPITIHDLRQALIGAKLLPIVGLAAA